MSCGMTALLLSAAVFFVGVDLFGLACSSAHDAPTDYATDEAACERLDRQVDELMRRG